MTTVDIKSFDSIFSNFNKVVEEEVKEECEHTFKADLAGQVCITCGLVKKEIRNADLSDFSTTSTYLTYSTNNTFIRGAGEFGKKRIHTWSNNDNSYKFRSECSYIIKDILFINGVRKDIHSYVMENLNKMYVDENLRTRGKIKLGIFIHFIYEGCVLDNVNFDILKCLEREGMTISKYNDALLKLKKDINLDGYIIPDNVIELSTKFKMPVNTVINEYKDFLNSLETKYRKKKLAMLFNNYLARKVHR